MAIIGPSIARAVARSIRALRGNEVVGRRLAGEYRHSPVLERRLRVIFAMAADVSLGTRQASRIHPRAHFISLDKFPIGNDLGRPTR